MKHKTLLLITLLTFSIFSALTFINPTKASTQTFGYTTAGASQSSSMEDKMIGSEFTCYANGTVQNITAYIYSTGTTTNATAQIYFSNNTLIGNSSQTTITHTSSHWVTFTFETNYNVTAGTNYILNVWSETNAGYQTLHYDAGTTNQGHTDDGTYDNPPDPLVPSYNNNKYSIYCTIEETFSYNYYFYGLFDEDTGVLVDAGSRAVNVTAYWNDGTVSETFEVNGSDYQGFATSPEYFFFELGSVDREYWLSAEEGDTETTTIYIFNASLTSYTITFYDWTGALATYSWVSAIRSINGTSVVVDKRKVDEKIKVIMGLQIYKKYTIQLEAIAGTTYTWGDLAMDSDTSVNLAVKGTEFPQDVILAYRYVRVYGYRENYNTSYDSIVHIYEDTQEDTTTVNITIYYSNDTTAHSYEYSDTDSFTYNWSAAHNETEYYSIVTITHATYGTMIFRQSFMRGFADSAFDLDFLGALPGGIEASTLLPMGIMLVVTLGFSALTSGVGGVIFVGVAGLLTMVGFIDLDVNLLVLAAIVAIIYAVLKNYNRVTVR